MKIIEKWGYRFKDEEVTPEFLNENWGCLEELANSEDEIVKEINLISIEDIEEHGAPIVFKVKMEITDL